MKNLAILGSTGSIGTQTLEVVAANPELFNVKVLTAHTNVQLLAQQAKKFSPSIVVTTDESKFNELKKLLFGTSIEVRAGYDALNAAAADDDVNWVVGALVGFAGLESIIHAIDAGKNIALANKETLVVAGAIVMEKAKSKGIKLLPIDSEHSAIFQCLVGEEKHTIDKVILTASGGPFLNKKTNFLVNVKASHALQHPNWTMGAKISIDSATLMNKGLEMIEAKWLFDLQNEQIEVLIHPQSVIHSMVQFTDSSIKAQLGIPDMKLPIQYALCYPFRIENNFPKLNFKDYEKLSFEEPDIKTFKNLALAIDAMFRGGNSPCILNAANEVVVEAFLKNKVGFLEMSAIIENILDKTTFIENPTLEALIHTDKEVRFLTQEAINNGEFLH